MILTPDAIDLLASTIEKCQVWFDRPVAEVTPPMWAEACKLTLR